MHLQHRYSIILTHSKTRTRQVTCVSRVGYVSDTDTAGIRPGYVSTACPRIPAYLGRKLTNGYVSAQFGYGPAQLTTIPFSFDLLPTPPTRRVRTQPPPARRPPATSLRLCSPGTSLRPCSPAANDADPARGLASGGSGSGGHCRRWPRGRQRFRMQSPLAGALGLRGAATPSARAPAAGLWSAPSAGVWALGGRHFLPLRGPAPLPPVARGSGGRRRRSPRGRQRSRVCCPADAPSSSNIANTNKRNKRGPISALEKAWALEDRKHLDALISRAISRVIN